MDRTHDDDALRTLLSSPRRIAVVGASPDPGRASHNIYTFLREQGHHVLAVNPVADEVAGDAAVPDLEAAVAHWGAPPEIVDVFRRAEHLPEVVEAAIAVDAAWIWTQFGVVDEDAQARALAAGKDIVVDRCIKVETMRLV